MNKICTSLEQSKKLLELGIDVNTSDMGWNVFVDDTKRILPIDDWNLVKDGSGNVKFYHAWSLSALMNLLPSEFTEVGKYSETTYKIDIRKYALTDDVDIYQIAYGNYHWYEDGDHSWSDMINSGEKEELIDAAFQMVVWLLENKKI